MEYHFREYYLLLFYYFLPSIHHYGIAIQIKDVITSRICTVVDRTCSIFYIIFVMGLVKLFKRISFCFYRVLGPDN
jgi:hypothetical protein